MEERSKPSIGDKLREFWQNTKRIVRVARRPTFQEVRLIARVSGIGILIVGVVAYLIQILGNMVNGFFKPDTSTTTGGRAILLMSLVLGISIDLPAIILSLFTSPALLLMISGIGLLSKYRTRSL